MSTNVSRSLPTRGWRVIKKTSSPLGVVLENLAGAPSPVEYRATSAVLGSNPYASIAPFVSSGTSSSDVEKNTFPSSARKAGRNPNIWKLGPSSAVLLGRVGEVPLVPSAAQEAQERESPLAS